MNAETSKDVLPSAPVATQIRRIHFKDLTDSLKAGLSDFAAAPAYGLFFGLFYALSGTTLVSIAWYFGQYMAVLPLIMGFALIGPFAAVGLYEVSRRLEAGLPLSFPIVLGSIRHHSTRQIMMLGFALMVLLLFWVRVALLIYALNFGLRPINLLTMDGDALFSSTAITFLLTGTLVGAGFALFAFAISIFSFPHLLARDEDFMSAIILSIKGVTLNLPVMLLWGTIVGVLLIVAAVPAFLGLLVVLPVLGHTTWHLYHKTIA
ncbi:MAG: DUF2189 domain-containing protein [Bosea sp. (in: a-proteobacteria)]